jgi:hypothetical protein
MTKVLILCAGDGYRWGEYLGVPKQLININNEKLLDRTVRLLHKSEYRDIEIVSNDYRLKLSHCNFFKPLKFGWVVETLLSTKELWKTRTIVLLGDVFYTDFAIQTILNFKGCLGVFGRPWPSKYTTCNHGEIFALSFNKTSIGKVVNSANKALSYGISGGRGNLWNFYQSLVNFPFDVNKIESEYFNTIDDFTDDFDTPKDYRRSIYRYNFKTSSNPLKKIILSILIFIVTPMYYFKCKKYLIQR